MGPDPLTVVALPPEIGPAPFDIDEIRAAQDDTDTTDETVRERFRIENDEVAEWAMRKLARARTELARLEAEREAYAAQIEAWHAQESKGPASDAAFFESILDDYARRERDADDRKTVSLPSGKITTKEQPPALTINDEDALTSWLMGHGYHDLVKLSTGVKKVAPVASIVAEAGPIVSFTVDLECGHEIEVDLEESQRDDVEAALVEAMREEHPCPHCSPWDPPMMAATNAREIVPAEILAAKSPEGVEIPGLGVRDGSVSVTVKPNKAVN